MGFTFKGLTSAALVARGTEGAAGNNKDVASVPNAVENSTSVDLPRGHFDEKIGAPHNLSASDSDEDLTKVDTNAPTGVQAVQAATHVWTKRELILAYIFAWLIQFILAFASSIASYLAMYVTSQWQQHSLTALTWVISSVVSGLWKLPYAKIMNIWGRPFALVIGVVTITIGLIMMAACKNVQMFCAAMTFFYVGYNSIGFSLTVFVADTSQLKKRGLFLAYVGSPWFITTWVYGYAVDDIVKPGGIGLAWGFGVLAIFVPVTCLPLVYMFYRNEAKARKAGLVQSHNNGSTIGQKAYYYAREFDVIGILILATGLALFLLAFNLYTYQKDQWKSPLIICFLVFGGLLIAAFGLWEKFCAPVTFVPWHLLKNPTVIFTYTMAFTLYIGWYIWDTYFYSLLVVLFNQSDIHATYIGNTYTMGSTFIALVYGVCLLYYGKLKVYSLVWGVPLTILGVGLMIHFRQPDMNIGYIVMCQIFVAFGGGVLVISEQTTLMAVSKQEDFPALLACEAMVIAIGGAIGQTIAGAMWTGIFPEKLKQNLPEEAMANFTMIYGDVVTQRNYPWGSPTRDAINKSYGETQKLMLIAATCIYSVTLVSVVFWQNIDVKKMKQRTMGLL